MGKKIKILYVITKSNWGGAQRYVYDLATNIPKEIFEPVVIFGGEGKLKEKLLNKNIRFISIPRLNRDINLFEDFYVFFRLLKIFSEEKPDIIHLNSSKIGGLGALAGRLARVPKIVFTAHGWPFKEDRSWCQIIFIKFASQLTVALSHLTIAVSKKDFSDGSAFFSNKNKLRFIHNGIEGQIIETRDNAMRALSLENKLSPSSIVVGTIAELHKNKSISYAVKSAKILSDNNIKVTFVVIGEGEERKKIEETITMKNLNRSVFLLGKRSDAAKFLLAFDIFFLSSIKEGLPYVLLEAGAAGLPVVATKVGGTPEIIDHMKNGILVPPKNPKAMAEAIKFLIDNPEKRREFGEKLKEKVGKEFRLETMIEKTVNLYSVRNS